MIVFENLVELRNAKCGMVAKSYLKSLGTKYDKGFSWASLMEFLEPFSKEEMDMTPISFLIKRGVISLKEDK